MLTAESNEKRPTLSARRGQTMLAYNQQTFERDEATLYRFAYRLFDPREVSLNEPTDRIRALLLTQLTTEVNEYINAHYDQGSQASYQALYSLAATPQAVKDAILPLWPWIQSVMEYYYGKKGELRDGEAPEDVTWDFTQFDATDPGIDLEDFMGPQ
jgi:hypothetical protein